jgi:hypothetical protein
MFQFIQFGEWFCIPRLEIFQKEHSAGEKPSEFQVHCGKYACSDFWGNGCANYKRGQSSNDVH